MQPISKVNNNIFNNIHDSTQNNQLKETIITNFIKEGSEQTDRTPSNLRARSSRRFAPAQREEQKNQQDVYSEQNALIRYKKFPTNEFRNPLLFPTTLTTSSGCPIEEQKTALTPADKSQDTLPACEQQTNPKTSLSNSSSTVFFSQDPTQPPSPDVLSDGRFPLLKKIDQAIEKCLPEQAQAIVKDFFLRISNRENALAEALIKTNAVSLKEIQQAVVRLEKSEVTHPEINRLIRKGNQLSKATQAVQKALQNTHYFLDEEILKIVAVVQLKLHPEVKATNQQKPIYHDRKSDPAHPLIRSIIFHPTTKALFILHKSKQRFPTGDGKIPIIQGAFKTIKSVTMLSLKTFSTEPYIEMGLPEKYRKKISKAPRNILSLGMPSNNQEAQKATDRIYKELLDDWTFLQTHKLADLPYFSTAQHIVEHTKDMEIHGCDQKVIIYSGLSKKFSSTLPVQIKNKLSKEEYQVVFGNLLQGLQIFHSKNLIHGDINRNNIVINRSDPSTGEKIIECAYIDFGKSILIEQDNFYLDAYYGTVDFSAPESCNLRFLRNRVNLKRLDVFGLGTALYGVLFLDPKNDYFYRSPAGSEYSMGQYVKQKLILIDVAVRLEKDPYINGLQKIVANLLNPDPEQRFTADQALDAFNRLQ